MPLYEFECQACKTTFEELVRISDTRYDSVQCPTCKAKDVTRVLSATACCGSGVEASSGGGGGSCGSHGGFS